MWEDIKWWLVLIVTVLCFLSIPGLLQLLWESIKEEYNRREDK